MYKFLCMPKLWKITIDSNATNDGHILTGRKDFKNLTNIISNYWYSMKREI